jgi:hypothetical protein
VSLYHISAELQAVLAAADTTGGECKELDAALAEHAAALAEAFDSKADDYAALIRTCEVRAQARADEAKRMQKLADSDAALAERLRQTMLQAMQATGRTKVHTARFALGVQRNGGKAPLVVDDDKALPEQFVVPRVTQTIDRDAIREALERGEAVPGARLSERGVRLSIR